MKAKSLFALVALFIASASHAETTLSFSSPAGDWVGAGQTLSFAEPETAFTYSATANHNVINLSLNHPDHWYYLSLRAPSGEPLTPGVYNNATRYPFMAYDVAGLSFSGDGRGCNTLTGSFEIHALSFDDLGQIEHLDATFAQNCEGFMPTLLGEVLIDNRPEQPPLVVTHALDTTALLVRRGPVIVGGEVACTTDTEAQIRGTVVQQLSRWRVARAEFETTVACSPDPTPWTASAHSIEGSFAKGFAQVDVTIDAVDAYYGNTVTVMEASTVTLSVVR